MLGCCESEKYIIHACLIISSYIAVNNRETYGHVSWYVIGNVNNKPVSAFGNCNKEIL